MWEGLHVRGANPEASGGRRTEPGSLRRNRLSGYRAEIFPATEDIDSDKGRRSKSKEVKATQSQE